MPPFPPDSVAVVVGTRPDIVKLAGVARLLGPAARVVHSGQHYDETLSAVFVDQLGLPAPRVHLGIGGETRGQQIGSATSRLEGHFRDDPPRVVVVQGDTNTALGGALAANARDIPLVHVEAGLRSYDRRMPEEHNRVLVDHLADLCLAPTEVNRANLAAEGIAGGRVVVTGNTVVDAVLHLAPGPAEGARLAAAAGVPSGGFVLATIHRPENVDDGGVLRTVLEALGALPLPVLLPLHPRTARRVEEFDLGRLLDGIVVTAPIGYREFLALAAAADFIVSDSGGIQEEASVLKRPVIVVRRSTERPEVLGTFAALVLPGPEISAVATEWAADLSALHARLAAEPCPYGDGTASSRSVTAIEQAFAPG